MTPIKIYHRKNLLLPFLNEMPKTFEPNDYELAAQFTSDSTPVGGKEIIPGPETIYALSQNIHVSWTKKLVNSDLPRRSTSVGDVIQIGAVYHVCDMIGFKKISR